MTKETVNLAQKQKEAEQLLQNNNEWQEEQIEQPESQTQQKAQAQQNEKSWSELGLPEYENLSREELSKRLFFERKVSGKNANDLGQLRKKVAELEQKSDYSAQEKEQLQNQVQQVAEDLTQGELMDFNALYEKSPIKALLKYDKGGEFKKYVKDLVKEELGPENLQKMLGPVVSEEVEDAKFHAFLTANTWAQDPKIQEGMQQLDGPEALGPQNRSYDDLGKLAKLHYEDFKMYSAVYSEMSQYPSMSFDRAKKICELEMNAPNAQAAQQKLLENDKKIQKIANLGGRQAVSTQVPKIFPTVQEAMASED